MSNHDHLSIRQQTQILGLNRSSLYYKPIGISQYNILLMNLLDEQYTRTPFYGVEKMTIFLKETGHHVNVKELGDY